MLRQEQFIEELQKAGVDFFVGVPDSFLNGFCHLLSENFTMEHHIIAANEGNAAAIAAGHYFATGKIPLIYMQNSGIGNAVNPLLSLIDRNVYSVPVIMLIGWRGEPGTKDWAQHKKQGEITTKLLMDMGIPYEIIVEDTDIKAVVSRAVTRAGREKTPFALIAGKGIFTEKKKTSDDTSYPMSREEAIEIILEEMPEDTLYTATTGRATRELYYLREKRGEGHSHDFLNVGAMGHASSVALGLAVAKRDKRVVCLDGDSAAIMHMGAMTTVSKTEVPNFMHIVLNNGAHESVGGEPSAGFLIDFTGIARSSGYRTLDGAVTDAAELRQAIRKLKDMEKASFIDVRIHQGIRSDLSPLKVSHEELIQEFMNEIQREDEYNS